MTPTERVRAAIARTPSALPSHWTGLVSSRCDGPSASGSRTRFLDPDALVSALRAASWEEYDHPAVSAPASAFRTGDIGGVLGIVPIADLPPAVEVSLRDPHDTGELYAEAVLPVGPAVDFLTILLGPEGGAEVVYTFHPGPPIGPSTIRSAAYDGPRTLQPEAAAALGLTHAKCVRG